MRMRIEALFMRVVVRRTGVGAAPFTWEVHGDAATPVHVSDDRYKSMDAAYEERVLSKALTFRSSGTMYCVKTPGPGTALRGAKVTLHHFLAGGMAVHYKDRLLPVTAYRTYPVPDPAEDEKTLDVRLDAIVAAQPCPLAPSVRRGRG